MVNSIEYIVKTCVDKGHMKWENYYINYRDGVASLFRFGDLIEQGTVEDLAWDLLRWVDGVETIWGDF